MRYALAAQGAVIAGMSLAPDLGVAIIGAVLFGAATSITLTAAMSALQERLAAEQRVLGFAAFHTVIRGGLSIAAIAAGAATDAIGNVSWPVVGSLPSARLVLLGAGLLTLAAAMMLRTRVPGEAQRALGSCSVASS